jgi:hypothetical protein
VTSPSSPRFRRSLVASSSLLASALLTLVGCGASPDTALEPQPIDPVDCRTPGDCAAGHDCVAGTCVERPECRSDADCTGGRVCAVNGVCETRSIPPLPPPPETKDVCVKGELELTQRPANVVLLIDQSSSMHEHFDGGTRWEVLRNALLDEQTGAIKQLESSVRFGLALYSSQNGYGRAGDRTCPLLAGLDEIPIDFGNYAEIRDLFLAASPVDDTPTAESLAAVADELAQLPVDGPKAILLATDGEPDTCADPDAHGADTNRFTVETARATHAAGISTYVLSVGTEIAEEHLQAMANAGAGVPDGGSNAPFYRVTDQAGLRAALGSIVENTQSCTFHLEGDVSTSVVSQGTVKLDGQPITMGVDWRLDANGDLELLGARCDAVKTGHHAISAEFPCVKNGVPVVR